MPQSRAVEIPTEDGDFLDAEYIQGLGKGLVILTHGLEGSTSAVYMRSMAKEYLDLGWDVLAWNFRGCSGRINRLPKLYHSGAYEDLRDVIRFANQAWAPERVHLVGFSLGANLTLVTTAKMGNQWLKAHRVQKSVAISVPLNLAASSRKLESWYSWPYRFNFLRDMKAKIRQKASQFPDLIKVEGLHQLNTIFTFDDRYTAPLHGFAGAADYYRKASSIYQLPDIAIPTHIVVAVNDPMLSRGDYLQIPDLNPLVHFHLLEQGGHCGFWGLTLSNIWMNESP